ncbi:acyl carrier protein [Variovorax beijingensis]|uniref:acyl carrier protein n=1 Tax=Variovorax beijingensis TaxID=2496117 RepID=UPI00163A3653|nr:acyl carrier protein [Variovorax beijingensis]
MSTQQQQQQDIENWLADLIGEILEMSPQEVDRTARFDRYGLDSVAAVSVSVALGEHLGRELDATVIYDYPTIRKLSQHLAETSKAAEAAAEAQR